VTRCWRCSANCSNVNGLWDRRPVNSNRFNARQQAQRRLRISSVGLLDQAISLDPTHAEAFYKRGNGQKNLRQLRAALASYDRAIELDPNYGYAFCNRDVVLLEVQAPLIDPLANLAGVSQFIAATRAAAVRLSFAR
jgi:tetratricopeptide (TPR) repeat protein